MGGTGGSDYASGGGTSGPDVSSTDCSTLTFDATVASPDPEITTTLKLGDVLSVSREGQPPRLVLRTRPEAEYVGALTERWMDLVSCMDSGFEYCAEVIANGPLRVRLRPA